jgi:hypothetical protein
MQGVPLASWTHWTAQGHGLCQRSLGGRNLSLQIIKVGSKPSILSVQLLIAVNYLPQGGAKVAPHP